MIQVHSKLNIIELVGWCGSEWEAPIDTVVVSS